jgi:hypothetical protein
MKRFILLLFVSTVTISLKAQEPAWLDPVSRATKWPEEKFLTAFATEVVDKKQSETDALQQLNEVIKGQLSDAILVSINAQTEMNITVDNAATDQKLERRSASASDVDLVGLQLDSYFDKRKRSLYAFGYVSIDELAKYNRDIIFKNDNQISQNNNRFNASSNKTEKIDLTIEKLLSEIQRSVRLLTALGLSHGSDVSSLQKTANENQQRLDGLFKSRPVLLEHISQRLTNELLLSIPTGSQSDLKEGRIPYNTSEVSSEFSNALAKQLKNKLSEDSRLTFSATGKGEMNGSFLQNETETTFNAQLTNSKSQVIAVSEFAVATAAIETKGLALLPPNFEMIPNLETIQINAPQKFSIKPSEYVAKPIIIDCSLNGQPVTNLNLSIALELDGKKNTYPVVTDENGKVAFNLDESMVLAGENYLARIALNLVDYLSISKGNEYLKYIRSNQTLPEKAIDLEVLAPTVYIESKEEGINGILNVKVLEPAVKGGLSELRYAFTDDLASADYKLTIEALARKGQAGDIATLTFVDATISLVNRVNGKEIYKNSFFNVKGVGANFDVAQANAFQKAKSQLVDDITYELEYNR